MKKLIVLCICLISLLSFSGCFEPTDETTSFEYYVDDDFTNMTSGWNITHFKKIQEALSIAEDNDSIYVHSGIYNETMKINKRIILKGEDVLTTIIDGQHTSEDIILVEGNGWLDISGFTLRNSGTVQLFDKGVKYIYEEAAIDIRSTDNRIWENIFLNNTCGIHGMYADNNLVKHNLFDSNLEYGAYFLVSSDANQFIENVFINNPYALRLKGSFNSNVTGNVFMENQQGLFLCCGANYNLAYDNIFYNNSEWDANDIGDNYWDTGSVLIHGDQRQDTGQADATISDGFRGNFWDTYYLSSQGANDTNDDGIIDISFNIPLVDNDDNYPLRYPPIIANPFFSNEQLKILTDT